MIGSALSMAIQERWPFLEVTGKFPTEAEGITDLQNIHNIFVGEPTDTIDIHWPLKVVNKMPNPQSAKIWVASVFITGDMLRISIMKDKWCYENTLSDPESLNAFYTILDTYINDVAKIIPESHRIPQATNEPTLNELNAKRMRKAYNLPHLLPTKLQIRKWED